MHVFEPVAAFAERIAARFRRNDDIRVFPLGLGGSSRTEAIHLRGASSSTFRKDPDVETIEIEDIAAWLPEQDIRSIQLMKINIEGGEYELLERMIETGAVGLVDDIQVQFRNVAHDSAQRMELLQKKRAATHSATYQYRFVWENWTRNRRDDD